LPKFTAYFELWGKEWPEFLLGRGRNQDALEAARAMTGSKWAAVRSVGHAVAGNCLLAMNQPKEAQAELLKAEAELRQTVGTGALAASPDSVRPYIEALRAEMLQRSGRHNEASAILKEVQRQLRAIPGPDAWIQALFRLESIARTSRDVGDWALAEYTAKQMLEHDPSYPGAHYALALVAEHRRDLTTARKEFAVALKLWSKADPALNELRELRQKLGSELK
jgi:tetratricopeptide (TPR) repeat protein